MSKYLIKRDGILGLIDEEDFLTIYSRDCRSDDTKKWIGILDNHDILGIVISLYKISKRSKEFNGEKYPLLIFDRFISSELLSKGKFRIGTSSYSTT